MLLSGVFIAGNRRDAPASIAMAFALLAAGPVRAETLQEALASAYRDNPDLLAARSGQRANDENVPIQKSQGMPQLSGQVQGSTYVLDDPAARTYNRAISASANASLPIYQGGAVRNAVNAAKTRVAAGQYDLTATELQVFANVVTAYMDVMRDSAIVSLNQSNVRALDVNLRGSRDRFEVGDLTRTDVAQSESRLAVARANLETARANLIQSRETYIRMVGHEPDDLQAPPALPGLPDTPDTAVSVAVAANPSLASARKEREATGIDVKAARSRRLPTLAVTSGFSYFDALDTLRTPLAFEHTKQVTAGVTLRMPLYQGGLPAAQVRQSQARESSAMERETSVERGIVAQTRAFYASWKASLEVIQSSEVAVKATALSLEGVRAENSVGTRTIIEILNAEQEALQARVQLVSARRNAYVAAFSLLASMGKATAADLNLDGGALYNPQTNYDRVRNKWFDWDDDKVPRPVATSTVGTRAQTSDVPANMEY